VDVSDYIRVGTAGEMSYIVEQQHTAAEVGSGPRFGQDGGLEVLSTPGLIAFIECLAYRMLEQHLPDGLTSLGVQVQVSHMAPSILGSTVRVRVEISKIEGRRVTYLVQAWDGNELVGEGTHQRVVVDRKRFIQQLQAKRGG
jgi:fluoroacetyl-CoA thioesterase